MSNWGVAEKSSDGVRQVDAEINPWMEMSPVVKPVRVLIDAQ